MSEKQKETQEELNKSIDALIEDIFTEDSEENTEEVEKSIDIAKDASTTADEAANKAPKGQDDDKRGAGRPKQISDVPKNDMDGRRASEYDASITENEGKEDEPDEVDGQIESMDQTQDKKRMGGKPKAPAMRPFKKSENGEIEEISEEEYAEFQEFKKSKAEAEAQAKEAEELKKAEDAKKEQEDLLKSAVSAATEDLRKSMEDLKKTNDEQAEIIKAMANQPVRAKSITGIEQLEKSQDDSVKEPESFSKSEILDAAEELFKAGKLKDEHVVEIEMTGRVNDPQARNVIEKFLEKKN